MKFLHIGVICQISILPLFIWTNFIEKYQKEIKGLTLWDRGIINYFIGFILLTIFDFSNNSIRN